MRAIDVLDALVVHEHGQPRDDDAFISRTEKSHTLAEGVVMIRGDRYRITVQAEDHQA